MRRAMFEAEVGDDVYGEDPSVNLLESRVAEILGKEAALFVPSGTMGNQLALLVHTERGTEVIVERYCHIFNHEAAAGSWLSGVQINPVEGQNGILSAQQIASAVRTGQYGAPATSLICLENTHNHGGGRIQPLEILEDIHNLAREKNLPLHLDGARLWNASAASGIPEKKFASYFDTVSVCLSKGLGAPAGSVLAGLAENIQKARAYRSRLGGSMRQSGILAAAGLYALENHRKHLVKDHKRAKVLASALNKTPGFSVNPGEIESNIVYFNVANDAATKAVELFKQHRILVSATQKDTIRAVTHLNISDNDIHYVTEILNTYFKKPVTA